MNDSNSSSQLGSKDEIKIKYEQFIESLNSCIDSISKLSGQNTKFNNIQSSYLKTLNSLVEKSKEQMRHVLEGTVWDKLVIAFFGETNAGKSTIIETFRILFNDKERQQAILENGGNGVDGLIVGDGRSDFTKVYKEYNLEINGKPFVLIDVPGIEGKEEDYINEIASALKQAHCIFYIQGHNKKPDAATAEKIKRFLLDWVEVYSIYNVRGGVSDYDDEKERVTLLTDKKKETEQSIIEVFKDVLSGVYKGNLTCQAFLALNAIAKYHISREDLIIDQGDVIEYFGSSERLYDFSNMGKVVNLVEQKSTTFLETIYESNINKLSSLAKQIVDEVRSETEDRATNLEAFIEQLNAFKIDAADMYDNCRNNISSRINQKVNNIFDSLLTSLYNVIEEDGNSKSKSAKIDALSNSKIGELKRYVKEVISKEEHTLNDKLKQKRKDLDCVNGIELNMSVGLQDIDIDLNDALDDLDFNFLRDGLGKFAKSFLATGSLVGAGAGIGALFGGPVGAAIGAGVVGAAKLVKDIVVGDDDNKDKAKIAAKDQIEQAKILARKQIDPKIVSLSSRIQRDKTEAIKSIDIDIQNVTSVKDDIRNLCRKLQ